MIWGWLKAWWHGMWGLADLYRNGRSHRLETVSIGFLPIGYDCECGVHFWHSARYKVEYLAVRAAYPFKKASTGPTGQ